MDEKLDEGWGQPHGECDKLLRTTKRDASNKSHREDRYRNAADSHPGTGAVGNRKHEGSKSEEKEGVFVVMAVRWL